MHEDQLTALLGTYGLAHEEDSWLAKLFNSTEERLLAANLIELQDTNGRLSDAIVLEGETSDDSSVSASKYQTEELTAGEEWDDLELGFRATEWDVRRIDGPIQLAWRDPTSYNDVAVPYDSQDTPVAGIPQRGRKVWYRRQSSASADVTFRVEAWSG